MKNPLFRRVVTAAVASVAIASPVVAALPAQAETAPFIPLTSYLPGWTDEFVPSSSNDCVAGRITCVNSAIREMARVFEEDARSCSHNAIFSLAYLRITQTYRWTTLTPGYYQDHAFANHQDVVFAKYFLDAHQNWKSGNRADVPRSWLIAFDAGRDKRVNATGNLMLGMNAHINRDLPFVLASVGLVAPDGSSRKADFDKVEHFLNLATEALMAEAAQRFDPTIDDTNDPLTLAYFSIFQVISLWRENAWRNAEALVTAPTPQARADVAARIEAQANLVAEGIRQNQAYLWPLSSPTSRNNHCASHFDEAPSMAYPFGSASAF